MVHNGHAEDQIEALVVREEQIRAQVIETLIREVSASGSDHVFIATERDEPSLGWTEARRPATYTAAYLQNIERNLRIVFPSER